MPSSPPLVVADRYRLFAPLGQGGVGRVWRATGVGLPRDVAIKELVPPPGLTPEERQEMRERSLREARAIARLNNINVVRVFDVLRTDADPWIVMEYVPSSSLQDTLAASGPLWPVRAAGGASGRRGAPGRQAGECAAGGGRPGRTDRLWAGHCAWRPQCHSDRA